MASSTLIEKTPPPVNPPGYKFSSWLPWQPPTSDKCLQEAEEAVLDALCSSFEHMYVKVGPDVYMHTIVFEPDHPPSDDEEPLYPLVMVHGFGNGIPQFYKNFDHLHSNRKLYAIDLPGFARSTRVEYTPDADQCEQEFVDFIEKWREGVGLEKFVLLGHSLGGFLSCAYAMRHPNRVRHLILDDPWGFPERPPEEVNRRLSFGFVAVTVYLNQFNPFSPLRGSGPLGPYLVNRFRPDLYRIFGDDFMKYVYHCNVQSPTGEDAFHYLQLPVAWAKRPMLKRVDSELDPSIPITFIYGNRSWLDPSTGDKVRELRPNSYVRVYRIVRTGHHAHAEKWEEFNQITNRVLKVVDSDRDRVVVQQASSESESGVDSVEEDGEESTGTE